MHPALKTGFRAARSLGAVAAGYAVIVLGTILTFEVVLGGIGYATSGPLELLAAMLGAALAGTAGGYTAAALAGRNPVEHAVAVILPLIADTTFVIVSGVSPDPLWFDLAGSATLMVTAVAGGLLLAYQLGRRRDSALAA